MSTEQTTITFDRIKGYPLEALIFATEYFIDHGRPTPSNFPTTSDMVSKIWEWLDLHPEEKFKRMQFDAVEDHTYPVSKLWDGYRILVAQGEKAFARFAGLNRMPRNDKERVRMKHSVATRDREIDFNTNVNSMLAGIGG